MISDLLVIVEKLDDKKCKTHNKTFEIKVIEHELQFLCCCDQFREYLERKMDEEAFGYFRKDDETVH